MAANGSDDDQTRSFTILAAGILVSHYKIISKIGAGGMGEVYLAEDTKLKRQVALKFLPENLCKDEDCRARFKREAQATAALKHPNIITIYEVSEYKGRPFFAMEYVEGKSLQEIIKDKELPLNSIIDFAIQICQGLEKSHEADIVHRDIKPSNILIDSDNRPKILDFGLATIKGRERITRTGSTMGTIGHMSPEQAKGEEVDARSDLFSIGVILYEMITGKAPFRRENEAATINAILNEEPHPLARYRSDIPDSLQKVVDKALDKDIETRYQTAKGILGDINKYIKETKSVSSGSRTPFSIAVLSFANMSTDAENEYFSDGLAEDIINALTKIKRFRVAARTSAFAFKGKEAHIREIGEKLNVKTVLEGSVRKIGSRLRITAQLINVADGYHLWSEQYNRTMDDVFAIQDEITHAIVDNLKIELLREEKASLEKRYTEDLDAYDFYLKGKHFWNKRNEKGLKKAIDYFQQAIDKDRFYALAYTGLADCYNLIPWYSDFLPKEAYSKAKVAATRALEIDDTLAEAHNSLAWSIMFFDWDWAGAKREFKKAMELNPNYITAHQWYAYYLIFAARFDESLKEIKRALEMDPLSLIINDDVGMLYYYARQYNQAIKALHRTIELDANFSYTHCYLGWVYLQQAKYDNAMAEFLKEKELSKAWNPFLQTYIGITYARMGEKDKARQVLDYLMKTTKEIHVSPYLVAILYCALGKYDESFAWLDKALAERHLFLCFLKVDPLLDNLRSDRRFTTLLKKMGLDKIR